MKKAIFWCVVGAVAVAASVFTTISSIDPARELTDLQKENLRILAAGGSGGSGGSGGTDICLPESGYRCNKVMIFYGKEVPDPNPEGLAGYRKYWIEGDSLTPIK